MIRYHVLYWTTAGHECSKSEFTLVLNLVKEARGGGSSALLLIVVLAIAVILL